MQYIQLTNADGKVTKILNMHQIPYIIPHEYTYGPQVMVLELQAGGGKIAYYIETSMSLKEFGDLLLDCLPEDFPKFRELEYHEFNDYEVKQAKFNQTLEDLKKEGSIFPPFPTQFRNFPVLENNTQFPGFPMSE